jgi:hypothetical protein
MMIKIRQIKKQFYLNLKAIILTVVVIVTL